LWPDRSLPGVDAVVSLAGDAYMFDRAGLGELTTPVLAIGGTRDSDTPYQWGTAPTYQHAGSARRVRVALEDAGHMVFTNPCTAVRAVLTIVPNEFCSDRSWDRSRAHTVVAHFTTAFLLAELQQDSTAASQLDPAGVDLVDVRYAAQGYRGVPARPFRLHEASSLRANVTRW
jgi:predicted dienelactone hydrolase